MEVTKCLKLLQLNSRKLNLTKNWRQMIKESVLNMTIFLAGKKSQLVPETLHKEFLWKTLFNASL